MIKYESILLNKSNILEDNKGKIGVYRWINTATNESYVGSSTNIAKRLKKYYCNSYLRSKILKHNSRIYKSILEYNYSNFNLEILEYCNKESLISREQYYIDLLNPEYNILKKAGSCLGFKHSPETLLKFKNREPATGHVTIVINNDNKHRREYNSVRAAAKSIGVSHTTLLRYIKNSKLVNKTYKVYCVNIICKNITNTYIHIS